MTSNQTLKRKHNLFVSMCFVVGFIVGTGIFYLPGRILFEVGGNIRFGVLAWIAGALMIAPSVYMFSIFSSLYEKVHGFVDYSEEIVGKKFGYLAGWFFAVMYQPAGYAIIAWITSGFMAALVGFTPENQMPFRFFITAFIMGITFIVNYFVPKFPVKFNVATTVIRLIPLILVGTIGVIAGFFSRDYQISIETAVNFSDISIFGAISATAFAFNGWQAALAFNSEIVESKKKLPIALMGGFALVVVIYVLYFIGISTASNEALSAFVLGGAANFAYGTRLAVSSVFGAFAGNFLVLFMIVSGMGILNACCLGMSRAMYSLGKRGLGPNPKRMAELDINTNVPNNSMVIAVGISFMWFFVIYLTSATELTFSLPDFYNFSFFGLLMVIFVKFIFNKKDLSVFKGVICPIIALAGAGFMFTSYWLGNFNQTLIYLCTFIVLAVIGAFFYKSKK